MPLAVRIVRAGLALAAALLLARPAAAFPMSPFMPSQARPVGASVAAAPIYWSVAQSWNGIAACLNARGTGLGDRLAPYLADGGVDADVVGIALRDQSPALVEAFRALTDPLARRIAAGKADPIVSGCHDVSCATETVFGRELGPRLLLLAVAYRYNAADLAGQADRPWRIGELDDMLAAFGDLPAPWFPMDGKGFRTLLPRHQEAVIRLGPTPLPTENLLAVAGEGYPGVLIAAGWQRLDTRQRRVAMVHELAHEYARSGAAPAKLRRDWSGVMRGDRKLTHESDGRVGAISTYAEQGPEEDFAESLAAYRYMPADLQQRSPNRYAYLRDQVFAGVEYASEARCRPEPSRMTVAALGATADR